MAHPKKKGRKTKERLFLDFLKALVEAPVKFRNGKPVIFYEDVARILKTTPEKAMEIFEWGKKNGYKPIADAIYGYKIHKIRSAKAEQAQQGRTR